jgi:DNA-binding transcriptional LysR family regulator
MNCFEMAEKQFSNLKKLETGIVRIGVSTTLAKLYLLKYLDQFHKQYPNIAIQIFTDPSSILRTKLKDGSLDILIAKEEDEEDNDLEVNRLGVLHHCFIAGKNYEYLKDKVISFKELNMYPILLPKSPSTSRNVLEKYCQKYNIEISSKLEIASAGLLEEFVKIGLGIGFVTEEYAEKEIKDGSIFKLHTEYDVPKVGFALITLKNSYHSFGANAFIDILKKVD